MSRCVLHVGMPKTGTSSIQQSLAGFADDRHVWYEDHKGRTNHAAAIFELLGAGKPDPAQRRRRMNGEGRAVPSPTPDPDTRKQLERTISSLGSRTLVISGEGMLLLSREQLGELLAWLRSRGLADIEVVAYVRPFAGYVTSLARASKGGILKHLNFARRSSRYRDSFEKFDQVFGRDNVRLWKFDPKTFHAGCVVQDFCSRLGIDFPPERVVRANESIPREAVALLYTYRKYAEELGASEMSQAERFALIQRMGDVGSTKLSLSPDLLRPMLENNRDDIAWMEARLGESLAEDLGEPRPGDVCEERDLLRPDPAVVEKLLARLGDAAPEGVTGRTPREVAVLVHALRNGGMTPRGGRERGFRAFRPLRDRLAGRRANADAAPRPARAARADRDTRSGSALKAAELIGEIRRSDPASLGGIAPEAAEALVGQLFSHMSRTLAEAEEGVVSYPGLGRFRVRPAKGGAAGTGPARTRIVFVPENEPGRL